MLRDGDVVDGNYRVGARLSTTERADIHAVTHVRFPDVALVMKVSAASAAHDFDRDTDALTSLTSTCIAHVYDRGKLPDGRLYRVVERLEGPTLRAALAEDGFDDQRALELLVGLAALTHQASKNGVGPCDLSVDNLMFTNGRQSRLCLLRAIVPQGVGASPEADRAALAALREQLQRGAKSDWRPPSSMKELRADVARAGKITTPFDTSPGERVQRWKIGALVSESLRATVYEATPHAQTAAGNVTARCVLKLAGPEADPVEFVRHTRTLAKVTSKHVVHVHDFGKHNGVPFYVMDALHETLAARTKEGPLPIDAALQTVDELLWGALSIDSANGAPSDFSLEHTWTATASGSPAVLTHALAPLKSFRLHGKQRGPEYADAWSAAVTLYELVAGRLPFPTSKHSLAKAWLGVPVPLAARRRDVPSDVSDVVHAILTGAKISTADLRRELTRIRSTPAAMRSSLPPPTERTADPPSFPPPPPIPKAPTPLMAPLPRGGYSIVPRPSFLPAPGGSIAPGATLVDEKPWRFVAAPARCPIGYVHVACFRDSELAAVGPGAVARYRGGQWTVDPARDLAIVALVPFGEAGFLGLDGRGALYRLDGPGGFRPWGPPLGRFVFRGAIADSNGGMVLVGATADGRAAVVARLVGESITLLASRPDVPPLRAVASLAGGQLIAAGEHGVVARIEGGDIVEHLRACNASLLAVAAQDGIHAVGQGAWALRVTLGPLRAEPERVDTTASLGCLAHDGRTYWAGSERGGLFRRHASHWQRMSNADLGESAVLALAASAERVRALRADGQLLLGQPERT